MSEDMERDMMEQADQQLARERDDYEATCQELAALQGQLAQAQAACQELLTTINAIFKLNTTEPGYDVISYALEFPESDRQTIIRVLRGTFPVEWKGQA